MNRAIGALAGLKRGSKAKIRSIPRASAGSYLDLHAASLKMARLEREMKTIVERKKRLEQETQAVRSEIEMMKKARHGEGGQKTLRRSDVGIKRPLKTMILDY
ncbi:MAG: hypothetical protein AABY45_00685 [Deltaproteobacteria bacterium]